MKKKSNKDPYKIINVVFLGILLGVILYAALFNPENGNHPIPSSATFFTSRPVSSTGLSRSFSAIVRLQFSRADQYNPYGMRIFLFFFIQVFLRVAALILYHRIADSKQWRLIVADIFVTVVLLGYCFYPFIHALSRVFWM